MKRSEMINIIARSLPGAPDPLLDYDLAEKVLADIEHWGMQPPGYLGVFATGKAYNPKTDQGRDTHHFKGWEPEDAPSSQRGEDEV